MPEKLAHKLLLELENVLGSLQQRPQLFLMVCDDIPLFQGLKAVWLKSQLL